MDLPAKLVKLIIQNRNILPVLSDTWRSDVYEAHRTTTPRRIGRLGSELQAGPELANVFQAR
jgi:hypothetical protein